MQVFDNVLDMIGHTPMLRLRKFSAGPCELYLKLELFNPAGSIKDRIGVTMILEAEKRGQIKPGDTLVEATAGNTGLGLALVAAQRGYKLILVLPDKMSQEKIFNLRAMGAEIVLTRSDVAKGHPEYYQDLGARIAKEKGAYFVDQFANPDNPLAHERTTGPEIWQQMGGKLDAVVVGVGSSGTIAGLAHYFKKVAPHVELVLADPQGSVLTHFIETGQLTTKGSWLVEGIGEDFVSGICDFSLTKKAYSIADSESFATARALLKEEGILAGSSTGTLLSAALRYCRDQTQPKRVVTFACDTGSRYLSKLFNDFWMEDQGFIRREHFGDLRDLIGRPHDERATITVGPNDVVTTAHNRLRNSGISQLPVLDNAKLMGVLTEEDIMRFAFGHPDRLGAPVREAMQTAFISVPKEMPVKSLVSILQVAPYAVVLDGEQFLGLITRSDVLNHLRREVQS